MISETCCLLVSQLQLNEFDSILSSLGKKLVVEGEDIFYPALERDPKAYSYEFINVEQPFEDWPFFKYTLIEEELSPLNRKEFLIEEHEQLIYPGLPVAFSGIRFPVRPNDNIELKFTIASEDMEIIEDSTSVKFTDFSKLGDEREHTVKRT